MFARSSRVLARAAAAAATVGGGAGLLVSVNASNASVASCEPINFRAESLRLAEGALERVDKLLARMHALNSLADRIDHTLLRSDATVAEIEVLCAEAVEHGFKTVCVNSGNVQVAKEFLAKAAAAGKEHAVKVCAVVGFPLGACSTEAKAFETEAAILAGASEIDMVINIGRLKSGEWDYVVRDVAAVVAVCKRLGAGCKVIIETCLLNDEEKRAASELCALVGADFVKTSTGFSTGGATPEDVALMKASVDAAAAKYAPLAANGGSVKVKASGGIKDANDAWAMIRAGASRLGTSRGVSLVSTGDETAAPSPSAY